MRRWAGLALGLGLLAAGCDAGLPDADSQGARLYAARCSGCHRLYAPRVLTGEMWKITVARMQGELARRGLAPLSADEQALLLEYLDQHGTGKAG
jgi:Dihaem cytochrome c